jgi:hypothetical protein
MEHAPNTGEERGGTSQTQENLVDYVLGSLRHGLSFKAIARSVGMKDPWCLKRLMTQSLGYEFQLYKTLMMDEVCHKIQSLLPIHNEGRNWGICCVKAALARKDVRVSRNMIATALQTIAGMLFNPSHGNSLVFSCIIEFSPIIL